MIESVIRKKIAKIATITKTITVVVKVSLRVGQTILDASCRLCCINLKIFVTFFSLIIVEMLAFNTSITNTANRTEKQARLGRG